MKFLMTVFIVFCAPGVFAKTKSSEFNQLIAKQAQSQNETHSALKKEIESPAIDMNAADKTKVIISNRQVHIDSPPAATSKTVKAHLGSTEQIEQNDFNRLDQELENAK